jgi:branched-chain amino acid transport system permease protein
VATTATRSDRPVNRAQVGLSRLSVAGLLGVGVIGWFGLGLLGAGTVAIIVLCLYYAVAGSSFNFLYGSLGVFSLAQAVPLAVGGYTSIYLNNNYGISPWASLFIAPILAAIITLPIALAVVRAGAGPILTALITLIIFEAVPPLLIAFKALGGAVGLYDTILSDASFWDMQFASVTTFARILLVLNVVVIGFVMWWRSSRFGLFATATKDSLDAAEAIGIPTTRIRVATFLIASMIAAPAGVIYAQYNLLATANLFFGSTFFQVLVVVALVGGSARPWGSLIGAIVIIFLPEEVSDLADGRIAVGPLTFASLFILTALLFPRGISGAWAKAAARRPWPNRS